MQKIIMFNSHISTRSHIQIGDMASLSIVTIWLDVPERRETDFGKRQNAELYYRTYVNWSLLSILMIMVSQGKICVTLNGLGMLAIVIIQSLQFWMKIILELAEALEPFWTILQHFLKIFQLFFSSYATF